MFNNRKMNILKVYNYFDNIENVKSSQNRYVQYLFPFFPEFVFGSLRSKGQTESHRIVRVESQNRNFIQTNKGVQVKNVLPNNCANNNCLFE